MIFLFALFKVTKQSTELNHKKQKGKNQSLLDGVGINLRSLRQQVLCFFNGFVGGTLPGGSFFFVLRD